MRGLLLINLGTPEEPEPGPVKTYLRQFLNDERVIDINPLARKALLTVILSKRPKQSAEAYKKVWTDRGSPLLFHSQDLKAAVADQLADEWMVELGMRYGSPSLESAMDKLIRAGVDDIVVFPLYPQYASSSTGTALEEIYRMCAAKWNVPRLHVVPPFYDDPRFIDAFVAVGAPVLEEQQPDHVLFSYHGLPERHVIKSDESERRHCLQSEGCCDVITSVNRHCYRAQCFATTRALVTALELTPSQYSVSFQSRLGRTPWIQPFTDEVLPALVERGVKKLVVFCPSFVADCLETLEEVAIRGAEQFTEAGGESLTLVPSLNSHPVWVEAVVALGRGVA